VAYPSHGYFHPLTTLSSAPLAVVDLFSISHKMCLLARWPVGVLTGLSVWSTKGREQLNSRPFDDHDEE
jgi:hypothetical protein